MKTIISQNYTQKQFYLVVTPNDEGGWQVVHNIWPNTEHGGGQVLKSDFVSKEQAVDWANSQSDGEKVVIDEISGRQRYNEFLQKGEKGHVQR
jgi:hypothetical protein